MTHFQRWSFPLVAVLAMLSCGCASHNHRHHHEEGKLENAAVPKLQFPEDALLFYYGPLGLARTELPAPGTVYVVDQDAATIKLVVTTTDEDFDLEDFDAKDIQSIGLNPEHKVSLYFVPVEQFNCGDGQPPDEDDDKDSDHDQPDEK